MNEEDIRNAASHYGARCSFERLVKVGSLEHNGLRYDHIIPWNSSQDEWVKQETRITGSTLDLMEKSEVRNFALLDPECKTYYAYASEELKTWFITPNKFCPIRNTRLLMILRCTASQEPLSIAGTYPAVDDVVCDYQNGAIKVVEAKLV